MHAAPREHPLPSGVQGEGPGLQLGGHSGLWPALFPPSQPHLDILIPTAGGGKAPAGGRTREQAPRAFVSVTVGCVSLLRHVPRHPEVTVHVSKGCVRVGLWV